MPGMGQTLVLVSDARLKQMSDDLVKLGDRLEAAGDRDWLTVAQAAALVNGLRFEVVTLDGVGHGQATN